MFSRLCSQIAHTLELASTDPLDAYYGVTPSRSSGLTAASIILSRHGYTPDTFLSEIHRRTSDKYVYTSIFSLLLEDCDPI